MNLLEDLGSGCDSAVGGTLPQIRGESLVFGETEGELQRERDLGCSSENGVSIFCLHFCLHQRLDVQHGDGSIQVCGARAALGKNLYG